MRTLIHPLEADGPFRLHLPHGVHDFPSVEEAVAYAQEVLPAQIGALAQRVGAGQVEVRMRRRDQRAMAAAGWEQEIYLGTELVFIEVGRPSPAHGRAKS